MRAMSSTDGSGPPRVAVFTIAPILVVTIEDGMAHINVGGQGFWVARAIRALGGAPVVCAPFGGETGHTSILLLADDGWDLAITETTASCGLYLERREPHGTARSCIEEVAAEPLRPRDLDDVYESALQHGIATGTCVVTGSPFPDHLEPATVHRLCNDLHAAGVATVADLDGDQLDAALDAGIDWLKVADDQLADDGRCEAGHEGDWAAGVIAKGSVRRAVVVSSADGVTVAHTPDAVFEARGPSFDVMDPRGSGDAMCAALALANALDHDVPTALRFGIAAGATNATRKSTASPGVGAVTELADTVEVARRA
jgi:fructose-1-phosphate kinase PfkB-like protein